MLTIPAFSNKKTIEVGKQEVLNHTIAFFVGAVLYFLFGVLYKWINPEYYDPYYQRLIISALFFAFGVSMLIWRVVAEWVLEASYYFGFLILAHVLWLTYQNDFDPLYFVGFVVTFFGIGVGIYTRAKLRIFVFSVGLILIGLILGADISFPFRVFYFIFSFLVTFLIYIAVDNRLEKEQSLSQQRNVMETIFEESHDALFLTNMATWEIEDCNKRAVELFEVSDKEELLGPVTQEFLKQSFSEKAINEIQKKNLEQGFWTSEVVFKTQNGKEFWGDMGLKRVQINKSKYLLVRISDIDEKKQALKELENRESLFRLLAENANDLISKHTWEGYFTYASPATQTILQRDPEALIGRDISEFAHPEDSVALLEFRKSYHLQGTPSTFSFRVQRKDGEYIWMETSLRAIKDESDQVSEIIAISRDITERKLTEQKLQYRESLMGVMARASNQLLMADNYDEGLHSALAVLGGNVDIDRAFIMEATERPESQEDFYLHLTYEWAGNWVAGTLEQVDFQGIPFGTTFPNIRHQLLANETITGCTSSLGVKEKEFFEERDTESVLIVPVFLRHNFMGILGFERCQGEKLWAEVEMTVLSALGGTIGGAIANRNADEKIREAKDEAEEAVKSKSEFLATMSHEIRTPMNAVIGMTNLLLETNLDEEQKEYVDIVKLSGNNLLDLINDILDFSKIESGQMDLEEQPFELHKCIEDAYDLLANSATEKGLELGYFFDQGVEDVIQGDVSRLRQVLVNLVNNAVKFTEDGEIMTKVALAEEIENHLKLQISVSDTGIGIPEDKQKALFQAFTQADSSTTREYGGTGLGLAISQKLVKMMGGEIGVQSREEEGSTFYFTAWFKKSNATPEPFIKGEVAELKGKRALLIDDTESISRLLKRSLERWGILTKLTNGQFEGIENPSSYDLLIYKATFNDDVEQVNILAKRELYKVSSILISHSGLIDQVSDAIKQNIDKHVIKPVKLADFYESVYNLVCGQKTSIDGSSSGTDQLSTDLAKQFPMKILLAEDNVINQKLGVKVLEKMGYKADVAGNGIEVLEALNTKDYDLIFMDIQMPEKDGIETTKEILDQERYPSKPIIIAMTAAAMEKDKEKCLKAGMDDYLSKPINFDKLKELIEKWGEQVNN